MPHRQGATKVPTADRTLMLLQNGGFRSPPLGGVAALSRAPKLFDNDLGERRWTVLIAGDISNRRV